jgi:hypothetical protein
MRLAIADVVELPFFMEVGLCGIPAHAWELSTAQQLLGASCWSHALHTDMAAHLDMFVFGLTCDVRCDKETIITIQIKVYMDLILVNLWY